MVKGESRYSKVSMFAEEIPKLIIDSNISKDKFSHKKGGFKPTSSSNARPIFNKKPYEVKQYTVNKSETLEYDVGDTVKHIKFGIGQVIEITEGGRDYEVTVDFITAGTKKMFASFAKLKKM